MDVSVKPLLLLLVLVFSSCAKMSYLFEQGRGQISLLTSAKKNQEILSDPNISQEIKEKVRKIGEYKSFFYRYFEKDSSEIYDKTTILKNEAVSYLVISSPWEKIEAKKECFPFMGCFPYLGFYSLDSAKEYARKMQDSDYVTYIRPVYAYSTLGYFTDTILSSFFVFDDYELSELIFHELFHTIFFIKDEVHLNESLANYFGKEMAIEYFRLDEKRKYEIEAKREFQRKMGLKIVSLANELQGIYGKSSPKNKDEADAIRNDFMNQRFKSEIRHLCDLNNKKDDECGVLKREWNNASFAAYMTYEGDSEEIAKLRYSLGLSLPAFLNYIQSKYQEFQKTTKEGTFARFLFNKGPEKS